MKLQSCLCLLLVTALPAAEPALKADKFLLIVHGTVLEVEKAKNILMQHKAEEATVHEVTIA